MVDVTVLPLCCARRPVCLFNIRPSVLLLSLLFKLRLHTSVIQHSLCALSDWRGLVHDADGGALLIFFWPKDVPIQPYFKLCPECKIYLICTLLPWYVN